MINWYFYRLKTFEFFEIPFRIRQFFNKYLEKYLLKNIKPNQNIKFTTSNIFLIASLKFEIFDSNLWVYGERFDYGNEIINWHKDIFSGKEFSLTFSKTISIRKDPELSAKNVWEINRLQFLPQIAINYNSTKDQKYLELFVRIIESWDKSNPYLIGINWYSNIEVNIRLINWFFAWEILDADQLINNNDYFKNFVDAIWIPLIYQHCKYSYANPSKYSSANNHLIAEYSGLFIASTKWQFKESEFWNNYSKKGLEIEIIKQHSNGINKEEAAEYIQFITDFFLIPLAVGNNTKNEFSENYRNTLNDIFEYIYNLTDKDCNFPQYGDEDDGKLFCLSNDNKHNNFKSLMTSASILFLDPSYKSKSGSFDLKNQILFGSEGERVFNDIPNYKIRQNSKFYPEEGHFIFRKQTNENEIYMHFDAAPLGYLSIAAHGHADALSFILHVNGHSIFIDSGTYSYHVAKEWREYFVSTMAHNTICIDNQNQSNHAGDTMWLNHYDTNILEVKKTENYESVSATHSGYKSCSHSRKIEFFRDLDTFIIHDFLNVIENKSHEICILFHLHPDVIINKIESNSVELILSKIKINLMIAGDENELEQVNGQHNPILGWYSESFMKKVPTTTLFLKKTIGSSQNFKTTIKLLNY